ncbi:MAG: PEGA domain-containing protein [Candidatus Aminicenantes bacterium]|jgi:DNA-binding beta-propeller fold protein YncE
MNREQIQQRCWAFGLVLLTVLFLGQGTGPTKLKVVVDDARVNETPEIRGRTLARLSLNAIVDAESKEGEWYRVSLELEGVKITGYMHEILVEPVSEEDLAVTATETFSSLEKTQEEIVVEIQSTMDESRELIRSDRDLKSAVVSLRPLIAKAFRVKDDQTQRELAAEIFLWIGMGYAGLENYERALEEIRSMFDVDYLYAKEITRNIFDPKIVSLIQFAENDFLGRLTEYSISLSTEPGRAQIKINGDEVGSSPGTFTAISPVVTIDVVKKGYKSIQEEIFLTQNDTRREYVLEPIGRNVFVKSDPPGAKVFLDGNDTGMVTECTLPLVPFGDHSIEILKLGYLGWTQEFSLEGSADPFLIDAVLTGASYEYLLKWGSVNSPLLESPKEVALDENNNVVTVDESKNKVQKFTTSGKLIQSWQPKGSRYKGIKTPADVVVDSEGYIYITDIKEHHVWKFDTNGNYIKTWGKEGTDEDELLRPTGIAVNSKNDVYIVDSGNLRVKVYSNLGVSMGILEKPKNMGLPVDVAVGPDDSVWVIDKIRVYEYSPEGTFLGSWGERGSRDGEFGNPKAIDIDKNGFIYIADGANNRIQKFDRDGKFITKWGESGSGVGRFATPSGIAVDKDGLVYVADSMNHRIQVFRISSLDEK